MKPFGLDLGTSLVKVAQLQPKGKSTKLAHFGWVSNPSGQNDYQEIVKDKKTLDAIKKLIKESGVEGREVVVSLPDEKVYSRILDMPVLSEAELNSAINWEAEQYIPVALDEVNLSWEVLSRPRVAGENAKMKVFLAAAPKKEINAQVELLKTLNLEPVAVETSSVALGRVVSRSDAVVLGMQVGWQSTNLFITQGETLVFVYSLPIGCESLTRAISEELNLDFYQAEEYRRSYGFETNALEGKVGQAMQLVYEQISSEAKRALDFYQTQNEGKSVSRAVVSGGGALTPDMATKLTQTLNVEVSVADPLSGLEYVEEKWPQELVTISPLMTEVVGLAAREID